VLRQIFCTPNIFWTSGFGPVNDVFCFVSSIAFAALKTHYPHADTKAVNWLDKLESDIHDFAMTNARPHSPWILCVLLVWIIYISATGLAATNLSAAARKSDLVTHRYSKPQTFARVNIEMPLSSSSAATGSAGPGWRCLPKINCPFFPGCLQVQGE
jgi:hypothetical protein